MSNRVLYMCKLSGKVLYPLIYSYFPDAWKSWVQNCVYSVLEYSQMYRRITIQTRNMYLYRVGENLNLDLFSSFTRSFSFNFLFIYFWLHRVFIVAQGFLIAVASVLEEHRFRNVGFSSFMHLVTPQHWHLPGPEIEPVCRHWRVDHNRWTTRQILKLDVEGKKLVRMFYLYKSTYFT